MCRQFPRYLVPAALGIVSFLVLYGGYAYVIAFQSGTNDCFFLFGRPFLMEFFGHPAVLVRYAGRFLGQFYHYPWLGALVASAAITAFGVLFGRVLARLGGAVPVAQVLVPCAVLVVLHTSTLWLLQDTLGLCAACAAFWGYLSLRAKGAKRAYALVATPLAYFLIGVYAWLFVGWVVAFEWLERPRRSGLAFKIGYVLFSAAVPLIAWRWVYMIPLRSALACPLLFEPPFRTGSLDQSWAFFAVDGTLAVVLCGLLLVLPFWGRLFSGTRFAAFWRAKPGRGNRACLAAALCVLAALVHWLRYDAPLATLVACRRLYQERRWDALLEKAKRNPYGDLRVQFMTNFALCQQGKLLDEMFHYPQPWGTRGLFLNFSGRRVSPAEDDTAEGMYNSDVLYEMGHANYSQRHAYDLICLHGNTYGALKRMAQCSMVNGNDELAGKYLNLLERTLFHRGFARRYKAVLADPGAAEREFGELRKRLPVTDDFGHPVAYFATLLHAKPDNRMALDYLMAWLLLDRRRDSIESICAGIGQLRTAGYDSIPAHCQEAMLLAERGGRAAVDLQGFRYNEATVARVDGFLREASLDWDREDADARMRARYGHTYMYYCLFVTTPADLQPIAGARGGLDGAAEHE